MRTELRRPRRRRWDVPQRSTQVLAPPRPAGLSPADGRARVPPRRRTRASTGSDLTGHAPTATITTPATPGAPDGPPERVPLPRIMAVANQKGGVGKTTTAVNLGAALAELGYRVLVVDLDPQGNATTGLGINARNLAVVDLRRAAATTCRIEDCIEPTAVRNLFVAPATIDLAGAEIELVPAFSRELRLRRALDRLDDDYDFILIDCPPSLGLLTVNGLAAATEVRRAHPVRVLRPRGPGPAPAQRGAGQAQPQPRASSLEPSSSPCTTPGPSCPTRSPRRCASTSAPKVCRNIVPRTVRLSEAPSFGQPIIVFDSDLPRAPSPTASWPRR